MAINLKGIKKAHDDKDFSLSSIYEKVNTLYNALKSKIDGDNKLKISGSDISGGTISKVNLDNSTEGTSRFSDIYLYNSILDIKSDKSGGYWNGITPTSGNVGPTVYFRDKNGNRLGWFSVYGTSDGGIRAAMRAYNWETDSERYNGESIDIYNQFGVQANRDGSISYLCSDKVKFKSDMKIPQIKSGWLPITTTSSYLLQQNIEFTGETFVSSPDVFLQIYYGSDSSLPSADREGAELVAGLTAVPSNITPSSFTLNIYNLTVASGKTLRVQWLAVTPI